MLIGLTNALATFQAVVNNALYKYLDVFALVYLDNILIYTKSTKKDYTEKVKLVLNKLEQYRLLIYLKKCKFYVIETKYLGYIILKNSVQIDPILIKAIVDKPTPKKLKGV